MGKKNQESVSQEVTTAQESVPAVSQNLDAWGQSEISQQDIVIPKILCMQGLSDLVADGKAKMGDFVESLSGDVIGSIDEPIEFVPFHMEKIYIISKREKGASRFEFDRIEKVEGQEYPFEDEVGDIQFKYEYCLQFYALRPGDTTLPVVLSFKSTSLKAGKVLATQMYVRNRAAGLVPPAYTMKLSGRKEKNDQGTYIVMDVKQAGKTSEDMVNECLNWFQTIQAGKAKVDTSSEHSAPAGEEAESTF